MDILPTSLPHASDWHSFLKPRDQAAASACTQVHAATRTTADITIMTAAGDRVTLSANTDVQTAYASYDARGRMAGQGLAVHVDAWQLAASHDSTITVDGNLNDAERADIDLLLDHLGTMVTDFLAGDLDDAVTPALDLGGLDTLAGFDAAFEHVQHVRVEQQYAAQGSGQATPAGAAKLLSSPLLNPQSIEPLLARMAQAVEASRVDPVTLIKALPQFTDRLRDTPAPQQEAEASKTKLAEHLLGQFAAELEALTAASRQRADVLGRFSQ